MLRKFASRLVMYGTICLIAATGSAHLAAGQDKPAPKSGDTIIKEVDIRPREATPGCWVHVWESGNFQDRDLVIWGSVAYPNMRGLTNSGGYDWGDQIDALIVGPNCYVLAYEDENFEDSQIWFVPNQTVPELDELGFGDDIDSIKLYDHPPKAYFKWLKIRAK